MNTDIEQLASHKDFAALSAAERLQVLAEMPPEEYDQLHKLIFASRHLDAAAEPPIPLRAKLMATMSEKSKPEGIRRLTRIPVPLWQAAAVLMGAVGLVYCLKKEVVVEKTITE